MGNECNFKNFFSCSVPDRIQLINDKIKSQKLEDKLPLVKESKDLYDAYIRLESIPTINQQRKAAGLPEIPYDVKDFTMYKYSPLYNENKKQIDDVQFREVKESLENIQNIENQVQEQKRQENLKSVNTLFARICKPLLPKDATELQIQKAINETTQNELLNGMELECENKQKPASLDQKQ